MELLRYSYWTKITSLSQAFIKIILPSIVIYFWGPPCLALQCMYQVPIYDCTYVRLSIV